MSAAERFEELSSELDSLADRLGDLAMDILREGLAGASEQAAVAATKREKMVNRARSAVVRAAALLERAADESPEGASEDDFAS
ncbi:MAG TPA: hypothetical protein VGP46_06875 [Acidimicrobiales bacterium]|nr:hypothetical protein [Acidimicrobiales bacterium]